MVGYWLLKSAFISYPRCFAALIIHLYRLFNTVRHTCPQSSPLVIESPEAHVSVRYDQGQRKQAAPVRTPTTRTHARTHTHTQTHTYMHTHTETGLHSDMHTITHTHRHTCTYTRIHTQRKREGWKEGWEREREIWMLIKSWP